MTRVVIQALAAALLTVLLFPPAQVRAADDPPKHLMKLLQAETDRIAEMSRLATAKRLPAPPAYPPGGPDVASSCGTVARRIIPVMATEELQTALAAAQPGDLIHLADGVYSWPIASNEENPKRQQPGINRFLATVSGTAEAPIALCGSRQAILDGGSINNGYAFTLKADYWILSGFTVRNAAKGIVVDGGHHNILRALEVAHIGDEGVHFRNFSVNNRIEQSWIHDVGLRSPRYGEGVYIGSAYSNWPTYTNGRPDGSDQNEVIGNLIGPHISAESIDIKEGTTGGTIRGNILLGGSMVSADSLVDLKGNGYTVADNTGSYASSTTLKAPVDTIVILTGWGQNNIVLNNSVEQEQFVDGLQPFRAAYGPDEQVSIVLPQRSAAYRLAEIVARFPDAFDRVETGIFLLKEHLVVGPGARLAITSQDVRELRLLSTSARFTSIVAVRAEILIAGSERGRVAIQSWDSALAAPDEEHLTNGRAYVLVRGGRMDIDHSDFSNLGFAIGHTSGAGWQGFEDEKSQGNVTNSGFERNYYGAYTYQAEGMRWSNNVFSNNYGYGFDPHDFSNNFVVEDNIASNNGTHGLIFSRGCYGNILRRNQSFGNRGYGIMIDDGKVKEDGNPRHAQAVPSNDNLIEANHIWNNDIGVALEGGSGNIVRYNNIHNNAFGISIKDHAHDAQVTGNTIRTSEKFGIYIYNASNRVRVSNNSIADGIGGIVIKNSTAARIEYNVIRGIRGSGIDLSGNVQNAVIIDNTISGRGGAAIDQSTTNRLTEEQLRSNNITRWDFTGQVTLVETIEAFFRHHPAIVIWIIILLLSLSGLRPVRWWRSRRFTLE